MPSHFPGLSGSSRTFSSAVPYFRWRQWIQHLQRIPASNRTRNDTGDLRTGFSDRSMILHRMSSLQ